jgi:hypothetical protein
MVLNARNIEITNGLYTLFLWGCVDSYITWAVGIGIYIIICHVHNYDTLDFSKYLIPFGTCGHLPAGLDIRVFKLLGRSYLYLMQLVVRTTYVFRALRFTRPGVLVSLNKTFIDCYLEALRHTT